MQNTEQLISNWKAATRAQRVEQDELDIVQARLDDADAKVKKAEDELAAATGVDVEVIIEQGLGAVH